MSVCMALFLKLTTKFLYVRYFFGKKVKNHSRGNTPQRKVIFAIVYDTKFAGLDFGKTLGEYDYCIIG